MGLDMLFPWDEEISRHRVRRERMDAIRRGLDEIPIGFFTVREFKSLLRFVTWQGSNPFEKDDFELLERKIAEFKNKFEQTLAEVACQADVDRLRRMFCKNCGANIKDDPDHCC